MNTNAYARAPRPGSLRASHPWGLSRPGSQGWTVMLLKVVGRMCKQVSPPLVNSSAWFPLHGTVIFRSSRALLQLHQAYFPQKRCVLWVGRALKSHPVSTSPGGGLPTSSLLLNHFTILPQQSQPSTLVGLGICLEGEG